MKYLVVFSRDFLEFNIISTLQFSDGITVSAQLIKPSNLEWASGYPVTDIENRTCVSWGGYTSGSLKIKNTPSHDLCKRKKIHK